MNKEEFLKNHEAKYVGHRFKEFIDFHEAKLHIYAYCLWCDGADIDECINMCSGQILSDAFITDQLVDTFGYKSNTLIPGEKDILHHELIQVHDKAQALESLIFDVSRSANVMGCDKMSKAQVAEINELVAYVNKAWVEFVERHKDEFTDSEEDT
jgi:hypothetical protein